MMLQFKSPSRFESASKLATEDLNAIRRTLTALGAYTPEERVKHMEKQSASNYLSNLNAQYEVPSFDFQIGVVKCVLQDQ